ncbi:MAG TPA: ATP synthase F0 subunit A [Sphingobacteriaceae bacterium]|nr:ATP synthase F0 subunit A [Sphingobacteriaceae bacterium]
MIINKNCLKKITGILLFFAFFITYNPSFSQVSHADSSAKAEHTAAGEQGYAKEKFNAGEMILEHIGDAHEWHILTFQDHHVTVPLPVILYNKGKFDVFMSGEFHHGEHEVTTKNGNVYRLNHKGKIESVDGSTFFDFSITKNVLTLLVSAIILLFIFISIANSYAKNKNKAPKGMQSLFEPFIIFIRDEVARPAIGPKYYRYMPFLLTIFFFIWINNMLGLIPIIPFGANITGNIAVTMTLALFTFIITMAVSNKNYWVHIINTPGVPWWLKFPLPLMPFVEILGVFTKPFVLTLRLFANMVAGHIIPLAFISLIFIFAEMSPTAGYGVSIVAVLISVFMRVLELLICFLQAYVFTLLSAMYFGMATEEHHGTDHH